MVQVPTVSSEAIEPETVQTVDVIDVKLTGSPELAVAVNVTPTDEFIAWFGIALKVIVWAVRPLPGASWGGRRMHRIADRDEPEGALQLKRLFELSLMLPLPSTVPPEVPTPVEPCTALLVSASEFACDTTPVPVKCLAVTTFQEPSSSNTTP